VFVNIQNDVIIGKLNLFDSFVLICEWIVIGFIAEFDKELFLLMICSLMNYKQAVTRNYESLQNLKVILTLLAKL
jgi:hypothetical protein